jgi:hypothetical protein
VITRVEANAVFVVSTPSAKVETEYVIMDYPNDPQYFARAEICDVVNDATVE